MLEHVSGKRRVAQMREKLKNGTLISKIETLCRKGALEMVRHIEVIQRRPQARSEAKKCDVLDAHRGLCNVGREWWHLSAGGRRLGGRRLVDDGGWHRARPKTTTCTIRYFLQQSTPRVERLVADWLAGKLKDSERRPISRPERGSPSRSLADGASSKGPRAWIRGLDA